MEKKDELLSLIFSHKNVSILSQGGTGKSTLITTIKKELEETSNLSFHITSTTGVSAYLIKGSTIHSYSGLGVIRPTNTIKDILTKIKKTSKQWFVLQQLIF